MISFRTQFPIKVPSKSIDKTPYEIRTRHKLVLSHLRVWGCPAYVKRLKTDKLRLKSDRYLFVEYLKKTKGYYFYLTVNKRCLSAVGQSF